MRWRVSVVWIHFCLASALLEAAASTGGRFAWPTEQAGFLQGESIERFLQPTQSGRMESALFGLVRNDGTRFHEGLDLRAFRRDRRGESLDAIFAIAGGRVVYVNRVAGNSSYGVYVVLEHDELEVPLYSLYAHLRDVEGGIQAGLRVEAGTQLGRMGRTAGGYTIPKARAHLHLEIGLRLTDSFDRWYASQPYGARNQHGPWNGINLVGLDPLHFLEQARAGELGNLRDYLWALPTAYTLQVATHRVPDFINRYPKLLTKPIPAEGVLGWQIDFTWYGLPKRWTPLESAPRLNAQAGQIFLAGVNWDELAGREARQTLLRDKNGAPSIGSYARRSLALLFGFY
ncbi:MAG: M23 family metallopeptidase [Opitutales bacterium]